MDSKALERLEYKRLFSAKKTQRPEEGLSTRSLFGINILKNPEEA